MTTTEIQKPRWSTWMKWYLQAMENRNQESAHCIRVWRFSEAFGPWKEWLTYLRQKEEIGFDFQWDIPAPVEYSTGRNLSPVGGLMGLSSMRIDGACNCFLDSCNHSCGGYSFKTAKLTLGKLSWEMFPSEIPVTVTWLTYVARQERAVTTDSS